MPSVDRCDQSSKQIISKLKTATNCCEDIKRLWLDFNNQAAEIASIPTLDSHRIVPTLVANVSQLKNVQSRISLDEPFEKLESDKTCLAYLEQYGIRRGDLAPRRLVTDKAGRFRALVDQPNVPEKAKEFVNHLYLKMTLPSLAGEITERASALHALVQSRYNSDHNGAYPLLKTDGSTYAINTIGARSVKNEADSSYSSRDVRKFISDKLTSEQRKELYAPLTVKRLEARDLSASEQTLARQHGVFATQAIGNGTCLGVYGGTAFSFDNLCGGKAIEIHDVKTWMSTDYVIDVTDDRDKSSKTYLDGNNILSKINTRLIRDGEDEWTQARDGYNAEAAGFRCQMSDGKYLKVHAVFATRDIARGEQIRMSYDHSPGVVQHTMETARRREGVDEDQLVASISSLTLNDSGANRKRTE